MTSTDTAIPSEVEPWRAAFWFFVSMRRFTGLAPRQHLAVNLRSADLLEKFKRGEFPAPGWEQSARDHAYEHGMALRQALLRSLAAVLAACLIGFVLAIRAEAVSTELPISWPKVLSLSGAMLAAWGTILQIGGYAESWKGRNLHEIVRPIIFRSLFLPGILLATLGVLL